MQRNRLCMWLLLLLCALACTSCSVQCSAQEVVTLSKQEWTELRAICGRQKILINNSLTDYLQLKKHLQISRQELREVKAQSKKLQLQLIESAETSKKLESSLTTANESLEQLNKEIKRQRRILKMQRTIGYSLAALLAYELVKEKMDDK